MRWPITLAVAGGAALVAWIVFHPEYEADRANIEPAVRAAIAKTGFKATSGITAAAFKTTRSFDGVSQTQEVKQKIAGVDAILTEKRTRRRSDFNLEESVGLYAGPFAIVRHTRSTIPIIADLLPTQFWSTSRISALSLDQVDPRFPREAGSSLHGRVSYDNTYADGGLAQKEEVLLRCAVREVRPATSVHPRLPGLASVIDCEEKSKPGASSNNAAPRSAPAPVDVKFTHVYVIDLGWSIASEGERTMRLESFSATETWKSELKSFDAL